MAMPSVPGGMFGGPAPQMTQQDVDSLPGMPPRKPGMFAGMSVNPGNALAGFMAGMYPKYADSFLAPMMQRQRIQGEMMAQERLQGLEFQRQLALAQAAARLKMQYPDSPLAQSLYQSGVDPGTPGWEAAMKRDVELKQNPVVNAGPYGPVLYNQVASAAKPAPTPAAIAALKANPSLASQYDDQFGAGESAKVLGNGGQTPPASGGFLGAPYPNIGRYSRY